MKLRALILAAAALSLTHGSQAELLRVAMSGEDFASTLQAYVQDQAQSPTLKQRRQLQIHRYLFSENAKNYAAGMKIVAKAFDSKNSDWTDLAFALQASWKDTFQVELQKFQASGEKSQSVFLRNSVIVGVGLYPLLRWGPARWGTRALSRFVPITAVGAGLLGSLLLSPGPRPPQVPASPFEILGLQKDKKLSGHDPVKDLLLSSVEFAAGALAAQGAESFTRKFLLNSKSNCFAWMRATLSARSDDRWYKRLLATLHPVPLVAGAGAWALSSAAFEASVSAYESFDSEQQIRQAQNEILATLKNRDAAGLRLAQDRFSLLVMARAAFQESTQKFPSADHKVFREYFENSEKVGAQPNAALQQIFERRLSEDSGLLLITAAAFLNQQGLEADDLRLRAQDFFTITQSFWMQAQEQSK